jgi:aerobic-type carbon monoxide dehydrogenase small subunit (CoxS/CutS family)
MLVLRRSPGLDQARGMFCLMGVCQECLVQVDGELVPSCMEPVREQMQVRVETLMRAGPQEDDS